ncbi:MAG: FkbM family methyltransferase [Streptomycetales bacterium]
MRSLRRRLLALPPKLGCSVTDVDPGTVLLSRQDGVRVVRLAAGARLVLRPGQARRHLPEVEKALHRYLVSEHVAWLLRNYRVNCVLDVGANVGQYARELRRAGYRGHIASFEPLPHIVDRLERAAARDPKWSVHPVALGTQDTATTMHVVQGTMSSILPPSEFGHRRFKRFRDVRSEQITVRRLDGMLDQVLDGIDNPRPYLKLDTQGYDLEAFAGLGARTGELVGLQSEVALLQIYQDMPRLPQALATYEAAGFEVTGMFPVTRDPQTGRVLEFDCVMARPAAL